MRANVSHQTQSVRKVELRTLRGTLLVLTRCRWSKRPKIEESKYVKIARAACIPKWLQLSRDSALFPPTGMVCGIPSFILHAKVGQSFCATHTQLSARQSVAQEFETYENPVLRPTNLRTSPWTTNHQLHAFYLQCGLGCGFRAYGHGIFHPATFLVHHNIAATAAPPPPC